MRHDAEQFTFDIRDKRRPKPVRASRRQGKPMPLSAEQVEWALLKQTEWALGVLVQATPVEARV